MARKTNTTTEAPAEVTEEVTTISAKDLASQLGVDPKAFRRWLRRHTENRAGKGGRWTFDASQVEELKAAFSKDAEAEATTDEA